jgi:UDP-2,3-diacylglucosamine hydrolase
LTDKKKIVFLADVHLSGERPDKEERFLKFLSGLKGRADALYVLGDLFDFWIGPRHLKLPEHARVIAALRDLTASGMKLVFLHGNRDFHVGAAFERATGAKVYPRGLALRLGGKKVYITHGDFLCTRDSRYHQFTAIIRGPLARKIFQLLPARWSVYLASGYRGHSRRVTKQKPGHVRGLVMKSVAAAFGPDYDVLVCGHVHPPEGPYMRELTLGGKPRALYVLGEWETGGSWLEYAGGRFQIHAL